MPKDKGFYRSLELLRDYFLFKKQAEKVEAVNTLLDYFDRNPKIFVLTREEAEHLFKFIMDVGYISHEKHEAIHELSNKLSEFLMEDMKRELQ